MGLTLTHKVNDGARISSDDGLLIDVTVIKLFSTDKGRIAKVIVSRDGAHNPYDIGYSEVNIPPSVSIRISDTPRTSLREVRLEYEAPRTYQITRYDLLMDLLTTNPNPVHKRKCVDR